MALQSNQQFDNTTVFAAEEVAYDRFPGAAGGEPTCREATDVEETGDDEFKLFSTEPVAEDSSNVHDKPFV